MNRTRSSTGIAAGAGLIALCVLGLFLRLRGVGYLLPTVTQLDGSVIVHQVETIRAGTSGAEHDQQAAYYPQLLARAVSVLPDPGRVGVGPARGLKEHLKLASAQWTQARMVSVFLAMLIVPGTWFLARRFLSSGWAMLAAALCTTSLLHIVFSSQERPHGTATSFGLLAVLSAIWLRRSNKVAAYLCAGAAAGLAVGSLHYGAFVLPAVLVAFLLREKGPGRASAWWSLAAIASVALCIRWLYPFHFTGGTGFLSLERVAGERALNLSGQPLKLDKFDGTGFGSMLSNAWSYDPVIFLSAVLGFALLAWRSRRGVTWIASDRRKDLAVVMAHAVPYFFVIGMYAETWERFLLPLIPYLACLGAFAARTVLVAASDRLRLSRAGAVGVSSLAAILPALALVPAIHVGIARSAPNTLACAAEWIQKHVAPADPIIVIPYVDLPLLHDDVALAENSKRPWASNWIRYQMQLTPAEKDGARYEVFVVPKPRLEAMKALAEDPMAYFREFHARYVVVEVDSSEGTNLDRARETLRKEGELVYRITPERIDTGRSTAFFQRHLEDVLDRPFFRFVLEAARMGPTLEIYRVRQP